MKTNSEVMEWCAGAEHEFGDPSAPVCQIFVRYVSDPKAYTGDEIVCWMEGGELVLSLARYPNHMPRLPLPLDIVTGKPEIADDELVAFGAEMVSLGVWALNPSLHLPGVIHAFVVLYNVPNPVPWERLIVLAG